jgi:glycosyltransferase involved in cell wall biosynthesis
MNSDRRPERRLLFVVPSLSLAAAQDEDVVQLLLFAAARLAHAPRSEGDHATATLLSVAGDTLGWPVCQSMLAAAALARVRVERLPDAPTPNLPTDRTHKAAYDFFEFLKTRTFDEVHVLDRGGVAYYATLARRLGLYFPGTTFVAHVVGGRFFRALAQDEPLDDFYALSDDLLERGTLERVDSICVHDRKAWRWYADKLRPSDAMHVDDLARAAEPRGTAVASASPPGAQRPAVVYYGHLAADDGLPLFCDAVERMLAAGSGPFDVAFVGAPAAMGGMDAVSYVRLRSAGWGVPITLRRDLSVADELASITELGGAVFCDTRKREGLRARLALASAMAVVHVTNDLSDADEGGRVTVRSDNPAHVAHALARAMRDRRAVERATPLDLWSHGRALPATSDAAPTPRLAAPAHAPKVSVCVTHFRRPGMLRVALESLRRQTYPNFEVIVVDDGSPDGEVRDELERIGREIAPLGWRVVTQENRYLGAARNHGAKLATGDYLLFMDDDNVAKPDELATLVAVACRTGAEIVTTFYDGFAGDGAPGGDAVVRYTPYGADPALGVFTNCFGDANALYARAAFEKLGGFTEDYGVTHEDWELFSRAAVAGVSMVCVPEPLFWYRIDDAGMFRAPRRLLHQVAHRRRHVRPHVDALPWWQAKLLTLAQGMAAELPVAPVDAATRATPPRLRSPASQLPFARVAVVIRTKDRPRLLERAVRSVLAQTFRDWVLVIVNDGGRAEDVALALGNVPDELAGRVLVVHHDVALGMPAAANAGIARCDSDFIAIHDDDDTWEPAFLARTVSYLDEHGWRADLGGVVTRTTIVLEEVRDDGTIHTHDRSPYNADLESLSLAQLAVENSFPPISLLVRRAAFDTVGAFQDRHGPLGDWDFNLRLLARFDIGVITAALANYHHRAKGIVGAYGNSVYAQIDVHRAKRTDLVNAALRSGGVPNGAAANGHAQGGLARDLTGLEEHGAEPAPAVHQGDRTGVSLAHLLAMGDLHHRMLEQQRREFQRLHRKVASIDNRIVHKLDRIGARVGAARAPRNLLVNGDFRRWPGPSPLRRVSDGGYAYVDVCPGFVLTFDGRQVGYVLERRTWESAGFELALGKHYLHVEREDNRGDGSWFTLELRVPDIETIAGRVICVSGIGRMFAATDEVKVTGRYHFGDRTLDWSLVILQIPQRFDAWSVDLPCPRIESHALGRNSFASILLMLPHDQPFELDLTDVQIEIGTTPSEFQYRSDGSPPVRALRRLRRRVRETLSRLRVDDESTR